MRWAPFLVGLLVLASLIPLAASSHTMGHRYLVYGRLIDSDGLPVQEQSVVIKITRQGSAIASINTRTDCLGDFENWDGTPGNDPPLNNQIEQQRNHDPPYIAFHFHDPELSNQLRVQLTVLGETWNETFHSETRQTSVRHQLASRATPAASCGGYTEFNTTFAFRVSALSPAEMETGDVEPKTRQVRVFFVDQQVATGSTDYNGAYYAKVTNRTANATLGLRVRIETSDVGARSYTLDETALKFRRLDQVAVVTEKPDFSWVWWLGGIVAGAGVVVAGFWGYSRLRGSMEENRLRQTTTRRRFRRGDT